MRIRDAFPDLGLLSALAFFILSGATGPNRIQAQDSSGAFSSDEGSEEALTLSMWARAYLEEAGESPRLGGSVPEARLERVRAMYFLSIDEKDWMDPLADSLEALKPGEEATEGDFVALEAYRGALQVVRAKHARWPANKLKHLRRGSRILDPLVEAHPDHLELRYLRYASYRFLPFFLSRDEAVSADRNVLLADLATDPGDLSPTVYRGMVQFLLEHAGPDPLQQERLETALRSLPEVDRFGMDSSSRDLER
jgi:hypothetical protein